MSMTYPPYRGMRYEEDEALKALLSGIVVPDAANRAVPVGCWFREPIQERTPATPPYIIIDYLSTDRDPSREHRGYGIFFGTEAYTDNPQTGIGTFPIPVMHRYQITTVTRNNQHDVIINDILMTTQLPFRFGQLNCLSGTCRRLDVESGPRDISRMITVEDGGKRREFRKVWSIAISAEIVDPILPVTSPTERVLTITDTDSGTVDFTATNEI
jgi:hypothetical protein